jgi:NADPH:quinone reductase-like Zn-dependent oxidoreductase
MPRDPYRGRPDPDAGAHVKAVIHHRYGGPEALEVADVPEPKVQIDSVLVRIRAAAINVADLAYRSGAMDAMVDAYFPVIPGWDISGVVERSGIGAPDFRPGDEVIGYVRDSVQRRHGGYAELVCADVRTLAPKPANLTWAQAAALPLSGLTAYQAVVRALAIRAGETVLVHGAAGGVGSLAAQIAVARGATVVGTASERSHPYLESLGVRSVAYGAGMAQQARQLLPTGADAILDCAGHGALAASAGLGRAHARIASVAEFGLPEAMSVFARLDHHDFCAMVEMAAAGHLVPRIGATYPLELAAEAHRALAAGEVHGKAVLHIS